MLIIILLIHKLITCYVEVLLLRIWMQLSNCYFYHPLSQFIIKITQPIINITRLVIKPFKILSTRYNNIIIIILISYIFLILKYLLLLNIEFKSIKIDYICLLIGLLSLVKSIGYLVFFIIMCSSIMNLLCFQNNIFYHVIFQLTRYVIFLTKNILPTVILGVDFSIIIIMLVLNILNFFGIYLFPNLWDFI